MCPNVMLITILKDFFEYYRLLYVKWEKWVKSGISKLCGEERIWVRGPSVSRGEEDVFIYCIKAREEREQFLVGVGLL
jgi:hypothetical protein